MAEKAAREEEVAGQLAAGVAAAVVAQAATARERQALVVEGGCHERGAFPEDGALRMASVVAGRGGEASRTCRWFRVYGVG